MYGVKEITLSSTQPLAADFHQHVRHFLPPIACAA
jgi:hypothetical protein